MTAETYEYETDDEREAREAEEAAEAAAKSGNSNSEGYYRRLLAKRDGEIATLKARTAEFERRDALDKATAEITAEGPLNAFLRTYTGEPTADAIRAAVSTDPDFGSLITFPPDPRDTAAAEQAGNAAKMAGGEQISGQTTPDDFAGWDMAKQVRFTEEHPNAWDALAAGNPVPTPPGW